MARRHATRISPPHACWLMKKAGDRRLRAIPGVAVYHRSRTPVLGRGAGRQRPR